MLNGIIIQYNQDAYYLGTSLVVQWLRIHLYCRCRVDPWSGNIPHAGEQLSPHCNC